MTEQLRSGWCGVTLHADDKWYTHGPESHMRCTGCVCTCHNGKEPWTGPVPKTKRRANKPFIVAKTMSSDELPDLTVDNSPKPVVVS